MHKKPRKRLRIFGIIGMDIIYVSKQFTHGVRVCPLHLSALPPLLPVHPKKNPNHPTVHVSAPSKGIPPDVPAIRR